MSDSDITRKEAIKVLEMFLHKQCSLGRTLFAYDANTIYDAVKMATDSLKADEAYQLEFEKTTNECKAEDCIRRSDVERLTYRYLQAPTDNHVAFYEHLLDLPSVYSESDKPSEDLIRQMKSEIADSLEFWDYSPNNNPLARDMLETINTYCAKMESEDTNDQT